MKTLDEGQKKIEKICAAIRQETLEPAQNQAKAIVEEAHQHAASIIKSAKEEAEQIHRNALKKIEQERNVFQSSLQQAARQTIESLKQQIESKLFEPNIDELVKKEMANPKVVANLVNAIVDAVQKEGMSANIAVLIPETLKPQEVNSLLIQSILQKLSNQSVEIGNFSGGIQVKMKDKRITIDITEETVKKLIAEYVRKDFRETIFA